MASMIDLAKRAFQRADQPEPSRDPVKAETERRLGRVEEAVERSETQLRMEAGDELSNT
jgi:hypothetical protein